MKVNNNQIQSLYAFRRQVSGGGFSARPLYGFLLLLLCIPVFILGAEPPDTSPRNNEAQLDVLFDQIMESLPDGMKSKVDSAGVVRSQRVHDTPATRENPDVQEQSTSARLRELPKELKLQVERAIKDMEQRKEERKAQFRESHGKN
jgi:hypothetical protein